MEVTKLRKKIKSRELSPKKLPIKTSGPKLVSNSRRLSARKRLENKRKSNRTQIQLMANTMIN